MLTLILMALWLALAAARKRKKWYLWAAIGAGISLVLNFAVFLPFDMILGDRDYDSEVETFAVLILLILNLVAGLVVTTKFIKKDEAPEGDPEAPGDPGPDADAEKAGDE